MNPIIRYIFKKDLIFFRPLFSVKFLVKHQLTLVEYKADKYIASFNGLYYVKPLVNYLIENNLIDIYSKNNVNLNKYISYGISELRNEVFIKFMMNKDVQNFKYTLSNIMGYKNIDLVKMILDKYLSNPGDRYLILKYLISDKDLVIYFKDNKTKKIFDITLSEKRYSDIINDVEYILANILCVSYVGVGLKDINKLL